MLFICCMCTSWISSSCLWCRCCMSSDASSSWGSAIRLLTLWQLCIYRPQCLLWFHKLTWYALTMHKHDHCHVLFQWHTRHFKMGRWLHLPPLPLEQLRPIYIHLWWKTHWWHRQWSRMALGAQKAPTFQYCFLIHWLDLESWLENCLFLHCKEEPLS